jgi:uridine phosphorylase
VIREYGYYTAIDLHLCRTMQAQHHHGIVASTDGFNGRRRSQLYKCDRKHSDSYAAYTRRMREGVYGSDIRRAKESREVSAYFNRLARTELGQLTVGKYAQVHPS